MTTKREKYNQEERRREILAAYPLPRAMWELAEASQRAQIEHLRREIERIEKQTPIDFFSPRHAGCPMLPSDRWNPGLPGRVGLPGALAIG